MTKIYFVTKLYNAFDKLRTLRLEKYLVDRLSDLKVYMPYRDSDEENIKSNWKQTIFQKDISELNSSDFVIGYWDGPCFDEGVGFEIGYALAKGKRVIILNDDFLSYGSLQKYSYKFNDPIVPLFDIEIIDVPFQMKSPDTYERDLEEVIELTLQAVFKSVSCEYTAMQKNQDNQDVFNKVYFETGSSLSICERIEDICSNKHNYAHSNRFMNFTTQSAEHDLVRALKAEKLYALAYNTELAPGTSMLCGMRYANQLPYYIVKDKCYNSYSMTGAEMTTNLMIDTGAAGYLSIKEI